MAGKQREIEWKVNENGCWICVSHALDKNGYPICKRGGRSKRVHRVFYEKYCGYIPDKMCVCHKCDNPSCINPEHLFLGTVGENNLDKLRKGRQKNVDGDKHGMSKLTLIQVKEIRSIEDKTYEELAQIYGVTKKQIGRIRRLERWKYLSEEFNEVKTRDKRKKLTYEQIKEIRELKGYSCYKISKMYNISPQHANEIQNNKVRVSK